MQPRQPTTCVFCCVPRDTLQFRVRGDAIRTRSAAGVIGAEIPFCPVRRFASVAKMSPRLLVACALLLVLNATAAPFSTNANRFTYLDADEPFYPGLHVPKFTTPQWVDEAGVDAVVVLSIDDMRHNESRYEAFLRPLLDRLKQIDGRAPVSILVNTMSPTNAQLQSWLAEGLSLECHTIAHPCPLCQKGDFAAAAATYHDCVDLMFSIPGNRPVAFRMPCCDSMNSPTPRFYAEMFNRTSAKGNFLTIDSSVMVVLTTNDPALPREVVLDADGRERFRKYLPAETNATTRVSMGSFATTIEDYPYPYVTGKLAWEFPCVVPSDWEAHNLHGSNNAKTVEDWKRALDAVVIKQGMMPIVFHPHGWIQSTQLVEFVDYAVSRYGKRVKFLTFREAEERLSRTIGKLRAASLDDGVRLIDLNNDGFMDVVRPRGRGGRAESVTRLWEPQSRSWRELPYPRRVAEATARFGVFGSNAPTVLWFGGTFVSVPPGAFTFTGTEWRAEREMLSPEALAQIEKTLGTNRLSATAPPFSGWILRDVDRDGRSELIVGEPRRSGVFKWEPPRWRKLDFTLPPGTSPVDEQGRDAGLRFVDVDGDGFDDVLFSNHERYSLHLFRKDSRDLRLRAGWTDELVSGVRSNALTDAIPPVVRAGTNRNNGAWFARGMMWVQNEDTAHLPDKVDRRAFKDWVMASHPKPLPASEALQTLRVRSGFKVELVASEPLVMDPVCFEWGADGRLWVVEMSDYPTGLDGKGKPGGRVRVLSDTNGDGVYDEAAIFMEGLDSPTGLYPWRDGVVISAAPEIIFARDSDGDGKADVRQVLFAGFTAGNQQHRLNGFDYGLDGWLYGANGDSGGNVRAVTTTGGAAPALGTNTVSIRGRDFRFHADTGAFEAIEGQTQYGRHRDDFDNWFGNNNPTWLWHYFFPDRYLARNPLLPLKTTKRLLANYSNSTRCFPISRLLSRFNDAHSANHVTSGSSPTPYRDELFGAEFVSSVFICEPVHNLVHREVLEPDGVTFRSRRATDERDSEFLASTDNWFRPVFARTGPDGALYVADMYRLVIEHPQWIPEEMQRRYDLRAGHDKGRIYRVTPTDAPRRAVPNLAKLSANELAAALDSPSGWQRDTAQRLLLERGEQSASAAIESHAKSAKDAKVRVQALWTLRGLGALADEVVVAALKDSDARVREHAIRLCERRANSAQVVQALAGLANDEATRVRFQLAFTLGELDSELAASALLRLANDDDENIRNAALSSAPRHARAMQALALRSATPMRGELIAMLQKLVAAKPGTAPTGPKIIVSTNVVSAEQRAARAQVLARYADVGKLRGNATRGAELFQQQCASCHRFKNAGAPVGPDLGMVSGKPVEQLVQAILDPNAALEERYRGVTVVAHDGRELTGVVVSETPTTLTLRAANQPETTFLRADLKEMATAGLSLMPEGFEGAFTPQQLADLIAYLGQ
jgi:putative membrane-bound dehydrogenase-like protein